MAIDPMQYEPKGDKKNSEFFETYKSKIYERRRSAGLDDLIGHIRALVVQVEQGDATRLSSGTLSDGALPFQCGLSKCHTPNFYFDIAAGISPLNCDGAAGIELHG